ncbi:hypothetical protein HYPDE_25503 [Hyphomicrobium denitrificans 1NES1]|uniref:Uncharacterized protein n=1 Tax=Hyphomicrobium denitrificans 1NES1 TaxID=670307 RepID=N0B9L3_9HYPH|nr:hypothetical protein HYPDE_25503 [Hyphomicrobium denitrificans 1NES1]
MADTHDRDLSFSFRKKAQRRLPISCHARATALLQVSITKSLEFVNFRVGSVMISNGLPHGEWNLPMANDSYCVDVLMLRAGPR